MPGKNRTPRRYYVTLFQQVPWEGTMVVEAMNADEARRIARARVLAALTSDGDGVVWQDWSGSEGRGPTVRNARLARNESEGVTWPIAEGAKGGGDV